MSQSVRWSAAESIANVVVGYGAAVAVQFAVFPLFGLEVSISDNLALGAVFTAVSLARSFALRRLFDWWRS